MESYVGPGGNDQRAREICSHDKNSTHNDKEEGGENQGPAVAPVKKISKEKEEAKQEKKSCQIGPEALRQVGVRVKSKPNHEAARQCGDSRQQKKKREISE